MARVLCIRGRARVTRAGSTALMPIIVLGDFNACSFYLEQDSQTLKSFV